MSIHRSIYALAVLAIFVAVAQCETVLIGERQDGDRLVESTTVVKPAKVGKQVMRTHLYIPKHGEKITAAELYDRNADPSGAHVKIVEGGLGNWYPTLFVFYTKPGYAIQYDVKIYAK